MYKKREKGRAGKRHRESETTLLYISEAVGKHLNNS